MSVSLEGAGITLASDGGGASAFNNISSGTNTSAIMIVGTGASLSAGGSGTIAATSVPAAGVSGLGTIATQNANAVAITGGAIDDTAVGGTTRANGAFAYVGIGKAASTSIPLDVTGSFTNPVGSVYGTAVGATVTLSGSNNAQSAYGLQLTTVVSQGSVNATATAAMTAGRFNVSTAAGGTGTVTGLIGVNATVTNASDGVLSNAYSLFVNAAGNSGAGSITTNHGIYVAAQTAGGTNYGIRSLTSAGTNNYNLYIDGTAKNFIQGETRVDNNIVVGSAALSTSATDKFIYNASCAGTPTGVPTTFTGRVPVIFDSTNNKMYAYLSGWKMFGANSSSMEAQLSGSLSATTYVINTYATYSYTINGIYGLKHTSGTSTLAVKINGTSVTGLSALSVTSTPQNATASGANTVAVGDQVTYVLSSVSSPVNLFSTLSITRT